MFYDVDDVVMCVSGVQTLESGQPHDGILGVCRPEAPGSDGQHRSCGHH